MQSLECWLPKVGSTTTPPCMATHVGRGLHPKAVIASVPPIHHARPVPSIVTDKTTFGQCITKVVLLKTRQLLLGRVRSRTARGCFFVRTSAALSSVRTVVVLSIRSLVQACKHVCLTCTALSYTSTFWAVCSMFQHQTKPLPNCFREAK